MFTHTNIYLYIYILVKRLVIWYGEILITCKFQIQQPERIKTVDNNRPLKRLSDC